MKLMGGSSTLRPPPPPRPDIFRCVGERSSNAYEFGYFTIWNSGKCCLSLAFGFVECVVAEQVVGEHLLRSWGAMRVRDSRPGSVSYRYGWFPRFARI